MHIRAGYVNHLLAVSADAIRRISLRSGPTLIKSHRGELVSRNGPTKDSEATNGFGMWKMSRMTRANISIFTRMSKHIPIIMAHPFGNSSTNRIASEARTNTNPCVANSKSSTASLVDCTRAYQLIYQLTIVRQ